MRTQNEKRRAGEKALHVFRVHINHEQNIGRNMGSDSHSDEVSYKMRKMLLDMKERQPLLYSSKGALTGVAQLVGYHPKEQRVAGWIPGQGKCLGCRSGPWRGCV